MTTNSTAARYKVVSADGHINEPVDLWTKDAPASLRELVPHVIREDDGGDAWVLAPGTPPRKMGTSASAGKRPEEYKSSAAYTAIRPGSFDPAARLEDMDIDGIDADVLYPGQGRALDQFATAEVRMYCAQRYNDWMAEYQAKDPSRLVGLAILPPVEDGPDVAKELERAAGLGLHAAFQALGDGEPLSSPNAERVWEVAADKGIPISLHVGSGKAHWQGARSTSSVFPGVAEGFLSISPMGVAEPFATLMFSGIFDKYPKAKVVLAESGIGWLPSLIQRMESVFDRHRHRLGTTHTRRPTEIFREHVKATFQEDQVGLALLDFLTPATLMWANDYPHSDTTWPESQAVIERDFADLKPEDKAAIVCENCINLYGLV